MFYCETGLTVAKLPKLSLQWWLPASASQNAAFQAWTPCRAYISIGIQTGFSCLFCPVVTLALVARVGFAELQKRAENLVGNVPPAGTGAVPGAFTYRLCTSDSTNLTGAQQISDLESYQICNFQRWRDCMGKKKNHTQMFLNPKNSHFETFCVLSLSDKAHSASSSSSSTQTGLSLLSPLQLAYNWYRSWNTTFYPSKYCTYLVLVAQACNSNTLGGGRITRWSPARAS